MPYTSHHLKLRFIILQLFLSVRRRPKAGSPATSSRELHVSLGRPANNLIQWYHSYRLPTRAPTANPIPARAHRQCLLPLSQPAFSPSVKLPLHSLTPSNSEASNQRSARCYSPEPKIKRKKAPTSLTNVILSTGAKYAPKEKNVQQNRKKPKRRLRRTPCPPRLFPPSQCHPKRYYLLRRKTPALRSVKFVHVPLTLKRKAFS